MQPKSKPGYVYKITSPSGKVYIGSTKDYVKRWSIYKNINCKDQPKLFNSLNKYGPDKHLFEIVWEGKAVDMFKMERLIGEELDALGKYGLNCQLPGYDNIPVKYSNDTLNKMSQSGKRPLQTPVLQYKLNGCFIKEWPSIKEAIEYYGKGLNIPNCCSGYKRSAGGFIWKYKIEGQMPELYIDPIKPRRIKKHVLQYTTEGVFLKEWHSASVASRELGININTISMCARGQRNRAGNFIWRYKGEGDVPSQLEVYMTSRPTKSIIQYDLFGHFVKEWPSIKSASESLSVHSSSIGACALGKLKSAGGFMWTRKVADDYPVKIQGVDRVSKILQYDLQGNFIREWGSSTEASKQLGLNRGHLSECLSGKLRSTGGFVWMRKSTGNQFDVNYCESLTAPNKN